MRRDTEGSIKRIVRSSVSRRRKGERLTSELDTAHAVRVVVHCESGHPVWIGRVFDPPLHWVDGLLEMLEALYIFSEQFLGGTNSTCLEAPLAAQLA